MLISFCNPHCVLGSGLVKWTSCPISDFERAAGSRHPSVCRETGQRLERGSGNSSCSRGPVATAAGLCPCDFTPLGWFLHLG